MIEPIIHSKRESKLHRVAVIPCTNQKSNISGPAREVWIGNNFQLTLAHAEMWYDEVFVMSYKYGLIHPEDKIDPYDINIYYASAGDRLKWWITLRQQIHVLGSREKDDTPPLPDLVAIYTGNYEQERIMREFVRAGMRNVIIPWKGARVGERMQLVYDNVPPYDDTELEEGKYELPEGWGEPKKRGRPKKTEEQKAEEARIKSVDEDDVEWEE